MKNVTLKQLLPIAILCAASSAICAQEALPDRTLRIATGPKTGVYTQLARDIQKVCGNVVNLVQVPSTGGVQNLMALSASEADIGFAQLDLLQQMGKGGEQNIQELQAIMPMHANLLHVLTMRAGSRVGITYVPFTDREVPLTGTVKVISKFTELKGVKVALVGSAKLLGQTLEKQLGYGMSFVEAETDDLAIAALVANQVQAVFTTGGWPYPAVSKHETNSGLMLADYDLPGQPPFAIGKRNYPKINAYDMKFLAAPNLLLTRPFKPTGEKGRLVAALQSCILSHIDELQEGSYHAVWKEIKNPTDTLGMTRYSGESAVAILRPVKASTQGRGK